MALGFVSAAVTLGLAVSSAHPIPYAYRDGDFALRLQASAVQADTGIADWPTTGAGHSSVDLRKGTGFDYGRCDATGAGVDLDEFFRQGLLENNGPPDAGNKGSVYNPTAARDKAPNLEPGDGFPARRGGLLWPARDALRVLEYRPEGLLSDASCDGDASGAATSSRVGGAGSTTSGRIDKATGEYVGVSRAFVSGFVTGPGVVDFVASSVQIRHLPGRAPVFDYRIAVNGTPVATGTAVAYGDVPAQFDEQVGPGTAGPAAIRALGLTLIGPMAGAKGDPERYVITFPSLEAATGAGSVRLLTHAYDGYARSVST